MSGALTFERLGDSALIVRFGTGIDPATNARVHEAAARIAMVELPGIRDLVPGYVSLGVHYDWEHWSGDQRCLAYERVRDVLHDVLTHDDLQIDATPQVVDIPVCYGGAHGADLAELAQRAGLSEHEVIARHAAADYRVAMLGFAPGFPYLLGLDPALATPRRATPRTRVPPGAVAIGGAQTAVYPRELPGGWNLIGRTPLVLFDLERSPPALLAPGDVVRFRAITPAEFDTLFTKKKE